MGRMSNVALTWDAITLLPPDKPPIGQGLRQALAMDPRRRPGRVVDDLELLCHEMCEF